MGVKNQTKQGCKTMPKLESTNQTSQSSTITPKFESRINLNKVAKECHQIGIKS